MELRSSGRKVPGLLLPVTNGQGNKIFIHISIRNIDEDTKKYYCLNWIGGIKIMFDVDE